MRKLSILAILTMLAASAVWAEGLPIEPGLWETTTEMTMSMMPQPMIKTTQKCVTDTEFDPQDLSQESGCTVQDYSASGNTLTFSMVCPGPEGPTTGQGTYVSNGDSGTGEMNMTMVISGSEQTMQMKWKGQRIGSC